MQSVVPPPLCSGDRVVVVSPSNSVANQQDVLRKACQVLAERLDVSVELSLHALGQRFYSSGTIEERLADIHAAFADPGVAAVLFSVGGATAIELLGGLDYELIRANPKIVAGISDASTLLNSIFAKTGLIGFHGLELLDLGRFEMPYTITSMRHLWIEKSKEKYKPNPDWKELRGELTSYEGWKTIKSGRATGLILGGNYESFVQLRATEYFPSISGAILVVETYRQSKRDIHRSLARLRLWGIFDQISALVVGYCLGSDEPGVVGNDRDIADVVRDVTDGYHFPVMQIGEIGHQVENLILPLGAMATLDADALTFALDSRAVSPHTAHSGRNAHSSTGLNAVSQRLPPSAGMPSS